MSSRSAGFTRRSLLSLLQVFAVLLLLPACSDSDDSTTEGPTPVVKKYVGLWRVTNVADASDYADMKIDADGTFKVFAPGTTSLKIYGPYTEVDPNNITGTWQHVSIATFHGRMTVSVTGDNTMDFTFIEDLAAGPKTAYFKGVRLQ